MSPYTIKTLRKKLKNIICCKIILENVHRIIARGHGFEKRTDMYRIFEKLHTMVQYFPNIGAVAIAVTLLDITGHLALPMDGASTEQSELPFEFVTRAEWGAAPPKEVAPLTSPPLVIIHHTYLPAACFTAETCKAAMRSMQRYHQVDNGWDDIGYNFAVGSEGRVYEGRGWGTRGTHVAAFNNRSIGICLIGDWRDELPPKEQLATTKQLIAYGVLQSLIPQNYTLLGHRQVLATACPGQALFDEIQTWPQYSPKNL